MQQNLTKHAPHIVLLMIGTNDINGDVDVANALNRLATLVDEMTETAPGEPAGGGANHPDTQPTSST